MTERFEMDNYWLERSIELDDQNLNWNRNRIKIFESLIRETAYFFVDIERFMPNPSPFDEGKVIVQCIKGIYDQKKAKAWVYTHLYGHAVRQANAIGILIEKSCIRSGFQLWRSLFEAYAICDFLVNSCKDTPQVFQDYISHSLLRSGIRHKENYNNLLREKGKNLYYDESEISWMKEIFKCKFGPLGDDYSWTRSIFEDTPDFKKILNNMDSDMKIFYHLSSKEIHPTIGHRFALAGLSLPLPMIPIMSIKDLFNLEEIYLDYLTAKPLVQMTSHISDFLTLNESLRERLESLRTLGKDVLNELITDVPSGN